LLDFAKNSQFSGECPDETGSHMTAHTTKLNQAVTMLANQNGPFQFEEFTTNGRDFVRQPMIFYDFLCTRWCAQGGSGAPRLFSGYGTAAFGAKRTKP
jgi:hypothetical protein